MQMTISFLWSLCLFGIVKSTSMYSYTVNNRHSETMCGPTQGNRSCIAGPEHKIKNCHIPAMYKPLFVERNWMDYDETDGQTTDRDCCCPTRVEFLNKLHDPFLDNTKNQRKKLAFGDCLEFKPFIIIGTCSGESGKCGKCREVKRERHLLIEENGKYKFDMFKLPSHCACIS